MPDNPGLRRMQIGLLTLLTERGRQPAGVRTRIFNEIEDIVTKFVYYDRKEDQHLTMDMLNQAVESGAVTVADMVGEFERRLHASFKDAS